MRASKPILIYLFLCLLCTTACEANLHHQARVEPYEASQFFADNRSARHLPAHVVPSGRPLDPEGFYTGRTAQGHLVVALPLTVTAEVTAHGQVQYDIFCSPCHGLTGSGDGTIVQRGFSPPPSFHSDELRQAPPGHYFDVISNGLGKMYGYADRIPPADRWAIIAYIRTLQSN